MTPKVSNVLEILGENAQFFNEDELMFNVTRHQFVPRHILASPEEKEHILNTFTLDAAGNQHPENIPNIFTIDPIVRYYNFQINDLIIIKCPRKDGFTNDFYRIVTLPVDDI